jgi:hypothetical protein
MKSKTRTKEITHAKAQASFVEWAIHFQLLRLPTADVLAAVKSWTKSRRQA